MKSKSILLVVILLTVIFSFGYLYRDKIGFSIYQDSVWLPRYLSASCMPRTDNMQKEIQISSHKDKPMWYHCTTEGTPGYVPLVEGIECEYTIKDGGLYYTVKECEGYTENNKDLDTNKCKEPYGGGAVDTIFTFRIEAGNSLYINTNKIIGDAQLFMKYPSYGLVVFKADNMKLATTTNCEINSLSKAYHTIDKESRTEIIPDVPLNIVDGLSLAYSKQLVTLSNVENGNPIYITRPGYYYIVDIADDGFKYVDTLSGEKYNKNIECMPGLGCDDNAKIIKLEDQSCDKYGGAITGYAPVTGDNTKLCKYSCKDGKLDLTSDCIKVKTDCPDDKPLWDTSTGECVSVIDYKPIDNEISLLPWILLGVIIIILLIVVFTTKKKSTGVF